jgi:dTDP-glucose pyrophosphorylase
VVISMAGRGQRFVDAGFEVPKPLIGVRGRPMYAWALDAVPEVVIGKLIFVGLDEHLGSGGLAADILDRFGHLDPQIVGLQQVTEGQACTVLAAREHIDPGLPLVVHNADTWCVTGLVTTLDDLGPEVRGVISVFEAEGDHWSFARLDDRGRVLETAEKRRISPYATTGLYHFSRAADFLAAADRMVREDDRVNGEFYVAPLYNRLIADGGVVLADVAQEVVVLGTPAELAANESRLP